MKNIWVEGDSLNIINCLNKISIPSWTISNIIYEAIHIINSFDTYVITHNFREANGTVDWAANVVCSSDHIIIQGLMILYLWMVANSFIMINGGLCKKKLKK